MTAEDLIDWLENAIMDSIDLDWTPRDAATLIVSRMQAEGLVLAPAHPPADLVEALQELVGEDLSGDVTPDNWKRETEYYRPVISWAMRHRARAALSRYAGGA